MSVWWNRVRFLSNSYQKFRILPNCLLLLTEATDHRGPRRDLRVRNPNAQCTASRTKQPTAVFSAPTWRRAFALLKVLTSWGLLGNRLRGDEP